MIKLNLTLKICIILMEKIMGSSFRGCLSSVFNIFKILFQMHFYCKKHCPFIVQIISNVFSYQISFQMFFSYQISFLMELEHLEDACLFLSIGIKMC